MRKIILLLTTVMLFSTTTALAAEYPSQVSYRMENGIFEVRKLYEMQSGQEPSVQVRQGFEQDGYRTLSGGQQQRVLLARALCAARKILLLDEPVSGLDPTAAAEMYSVVQKLNDRDGITVVMISHDISAALQYASHILHIGETTFFGTKAAYQAEFPLICRKEGEVQ